MLGVPAIPRLESLRSHLALSAADLHPSQANSNNNENENLNSDNNNVYHHQNNNNQQSTTPSSTAVASHPPVTVNPQHQFHANTSMDDYLEHVHPGSMTHAAASTSGTSGLAALHSDRSDSNTSDDFETNNTYNQQSQQQQQTQQFGTEPHRPGSISPRPSRGVSNKNRNYSQIIKEQQQSKQTQQQQQEEASIKRQTSLRRSPSMPSSSSTGSYDATATTAVNIPTTMSSSNSGGDARSPSVVHQHSHIDPTFLSHQQQQQQEKKITLQESSYRDSAEDLIQRALDSYDNNNNNDNVLSPTFPPTSSSSSSPCFDLVKCKPLERLHHLTAYNLGGGSSDSSSSNNNNNANEIPITSLAVSSRGNCLAWGDMSGRVFFLERGDSESAVSSSSSSTNNKPTIFSPVHGATAYVPFVDPLSSQDVKPQVAAMAFLPEISPATHILTANEKVPKLWRLVKVPTLAPAIRSVDLIGSRQVGPLTIPEQPTSVLKEVRKFNVDHEYNIHSLTVIRDGTQFISADEVTIRLWNIELEHRGLLLSTEQPSSSSSSSNSGSNSNDTGDGGGQSTQSTSDLSDVINTVHAAPHAPHTLLVGLSSGQVRLMDLRCNLRMNNSNSTAVVVGVPGGPRVCDGLYRAVASATLGCDLSLCGNYVAHRDLTCLHLFDLRKGCGSIQQQQNKTQTQTNFSSSSSSSSLVNRWIVQDHVAKHFGALYPLGSLFEKSSVRFVGNRLVTGGFGECLLSCSAIDIDENPSVVEIFGTEPEVVEVGGSGSGGGDGDMTTSDEDVARLYRRARLAKGSENSMRVSFFRDAATTQEQELYKTVDAVTPDQGAERNQVGDAREWRRICKLCTIPSTSWIPPPTSSSSSSSSNLENCGEVLATCGDTVHHVAVPLR